MITAERAALLAVFQAYLGYTFEDIVLLDQALTHRSYVHETVGNAADYERLEFLGDAVLGLIISAYVYTAYPTAREGLLSQLRARLVNQETLASLARQLDIGRFLRLGRGEDQHGGRDKASLLAAAFEAIVAALYLDGGSLKTQEVVLYHFRAVLEQCTVVMARLGLQGPAADPDLEQLWLYPHVSCGTRRRPGASQDISRAVDAEP